MAEALLPTIYDQETQYLRELQLTMPCAVNIEASRAL